jgi:pyruvate formate lyase activating enzyme
LPGTRSYSIATIGCNFKCGFCQNWDISQYTREQGTERAIPGGGPGGAEIPPERIIEQAGATGCASISYTYTEPTIYFEYAHDCMVLAKQNGLKNVFVSNGFESEHCVEACVGLLDAANIDLKSFSDGFYKSQCGGRLKPVLDTLRRMHRAGIWLEVTTLLIPGGNDSDAELQDLTGFIASELSPMVPWHVSAYTPRYKYQTGGPGATPVSSLERALSIGKRAGLMYLYAGNVRGHESSSTRCHSCGQVMITRDMFSVAQSRMQGGSCCNCGAKLPGVWEA